MTPAEARALLEVAEVAAEAEIRAAFARQMRRAHPDTAGADRLTVSLEMLREAREILLRDTKSKNNACKLCRGVGSVRAGMGWHTCSACDGTGERR